MPVSAHASECRALLAGLSVEKAHVVGHSYGAAVALQLAVDAPEAVVTLALFEPTFLAVPSAPQFFEAAGPIIERYNSGDRMGAVHAFFALVGVANVYLSAFGRLRIDIKSEGVQIARAERELESAAADTTEPSTRARR